MAKFISTTFMFTGILAAFLAVTAAQETCNEAGEFCGGIAGIQCCDGLDCILEGDFPDAGGKCTPKTVTCPKAGEFCGGIAGIQCCEGFECEIKDTFPDAGGVCKKRQACQKVGQNCGGFTITPYVCCQGLKCVLKDPQIPDIGGTCKRAYH